MLLFPVALRRDEPYLPRLRRILAEYLAVREYEPKLYGSYIAGGAHSGGQAGASFVGRGSCFTVGAP